MKAVITGITGFAASYLVERLLSQGHRVLGVSRKGTWPEDHDLPAEVRDQVPLVSWELTEPLSESTRTTISDFAPDFIYHLAAISVPSDCGDEEPTELALKSNVFATETLGQFALSLNPKPRFFFASSALVYGPVDVAGQSLDEDAVVQPRKGYGKSKQLAEQLLRPLTEAGLEVVIARSFQHTGPRQVPRMMLPEWIQQVARVPDEPIRVITMNCSMDLSDIRDAVAAYQTIAERGVAGGVYNVGSGVMTTGREVWSLIEQVAGREFQVNETSGREHIHPIADTGRLRQLGWQAKTPLKTTIEDTLAYWKGKESP